MAILDIEVPDELLSEVNQLAVNQYGQNDELSQAKVVQSALSMRLFWLGLLDGSNAAVKDEIEEPLTKWVFDQKDITPERIAEIGNWLFRRG